MTRTQIRRIVPFILLTVVFAGLLWRAEHKAETGISSVNRHITEVTSPCLRYGAGSRQCKRSFEAAVATIDHAEACAVLRKAGLRVDSCRGARLAQEQRQRVQEAKPTTADAVPSTGGDASSAPTGHSIPAPGDGGDGEPAKSGHAPAPGKSGSHEAPAPGDGGSEGSPAPTSSSSSQSSTSTTERVESTVVEPAPESSAAPVREAVGGVVEEVGSTVAGTVESVTGTTCSLAKVLCHE